ncbi:heme-dependent oxidative N-demethylase family protein [Pseudaestuariivita sp.]|uniref:heme-dependent oxidative N-demethylase family protein n=1 Tax=Pseudaestuariivita sp. TaxID=2211669 RepID=UPI004058E878
MQAAPILQHALPYVLDSTRRLPGIAPTEHWLIQDEAYAAQMAERARLIAELPEEVLALTPEGQPAAEELLRLVVDEAQGWDGFEVRDGAVRCPDGRAVAIDFAQPLETLAQLVQEDLCLLAPAGGGSVLTGAVLCFPASWRLSEKIGRPLPEIHAPVPEYDDGLARRVQRLFDAIRVGQVLMRHNLLWYARPELYQPRSEITPRKEAGPGEYLRSERQTLRRLPRTGAVVFAIHTYVLSPEDGLRAVSVR